MKIKIAKPKTLKINKIISLMLASILIFTSTGVYAAFNNPFGANNHLDEINRITALGIMETYEENDFRPDEKVTREKFVEYLIKAVGLEDEASVVKNKTYFSDISIDRPSNGYINTAIDKGFITGMPDGKFYPQQNITFSQVITALVRALGYNDNDVSGTWPDNYLKKANEIGLYDGIEVKSNDSISRWQLAVLLDHLLTSPLKNNPSTTIAQKNGLFVECIVLETPKTSDSLSKSEIMTSKGTFYIRDGLGELEPGRKYLFGIENDTVTNVFGDLSNLINVSVKDASGTIVTYIDENHNIKSIELPSKTTYYYKGKVQNYESIANLFQVNTSIVLNKNENGTGYEYGVIYDPIYSKPEIALNFNISNNQIGNISIDHTDITKNGTMIKKSEIEDKDVLYQVSDIWGINKYILVVDEKVEGEITAILPNKVSPKYIQINSSKYELNKYMDYSKINSNGFFKTGDKVIALLGYDGTVIDVISTATEDNSSFALVIDNYTKISNYKEDFGKEIYYIKLLHIDGTTKTYMLKNEEIGYNGELVKYRIVAAQDNDELETVEITKLEYLNPKEFTIDKEKKKIDYHYFSDNIKIFNIVMPIYGGDSDAYLMEWNELPNGLIPPGKIKYINAVGPFEDVNIIFVDNILDEDKKLGVVSSIETKGSSRQSLTYTNTILIDGKEYKTNSNLDGLYKDAIVQVRLRDNKIYSIDRMMSSWIDVTSIDAIDSTRIKANGNIYEFKDNLTIYFKDFEGNYERKGINDIVPLQKYGKISIYLDKSTKYDGKVEMIIVSPY